MLLLLLLLLWYTPSVAGGDERYMVNVGVGVAV